MIVESLKKRMAVAERPSLPDTTTCRPLQSKRVVAERPSLPDTTIKETLSNYKKQRIRKEARMPNLSEGSVKKRMAVAERLGLPSTTACGPLQLKRIVAERLRPPSTTDKKTLSNYKKQRIRAGDKAITW